jgi:protein-L-isoaspartate(D-aspartate) O-methyltransferase
MKTKSLQDLLTQSSSKASKMVRELQQQGIYHEDLLRLMLTIPRHEFVESAFSHLAYSATPLPIGRHQTISQPLTVARMSQWLLEYARLGRVLEIGTGSGYQTCILAHFFNKVHTIERHKPLLQQAQQRLQAAGLHNIEFHHGDGHLGWPSRLDVDAVIVTAMASKVPLALTNCLKEHGILIMPLNQPTPMIGCWRKVGEQWQRLQDEPAHFVPMLEGLDDA